MVNPAILVGRLMRDPELCTLPSGQDEFVWTQAVIAVRAGAILWSPCPVPAIAKQLGSLGLAVAAR
jgi:hypothetical protein